MLAKHLIVHIGWPKTGSTALQSLCKNKTKKLANHGFAYFAVGQTGLSCGEVSYALEKDQDVDTFAHDFDRWLESCKQHSVIISSEGFAGLAPERVMSWLQPKRWQKISIVAYIRPQAEYLEGWYKQYIKWGSKFSSKAFLKAPITPWDKADYLKHLLEWEEWCKNQSNSALRIRIFQPTELLNDNIGSDFFNALDADLRKLQSPNLNVSPCKELIDLYLQLPKIDRLQQINRALVASGLEGIVGTGDIFPDHIVQGIEDRFASSNEELRKRFFPNRDVLFAPNLNKPKKAVDIEALASLLIDTVAEMRGPQAAEMVKAALKPHI
ncbi:MAG: hypothetical protein AAF429_08235 [Pseudomonadota bacterium]